ncbi:unnamed protein product [Musa banksii]
MAEDFHTGICSEGCWWNPKRRASFDAQASTCSTAAAEIGGRAFSWASCGEAAGSAGGSSMISQETHEVQHSDVCPSLIIDSTTPSFGLSSSSMSWTKSLLNSVRPEGSFHATMLQEDPGSRPCTRQHPPVHSNQVHTGAESSIANPFSDIDHTCFLDHHHHHHFSSGKEFSDVGVASYHFPASYGYSSVMSQDESGIHDSGVMNRYQSPLVAYQGSSNELRQPSWAKFSQLLKSPLSKQQSQFTNNTLFWNASAAASVGDVKSILCSPTPSQFVMQPQTTCGNLAACRISPGGVQDSCSSSTKKTGSEPAVKKPRIETPSPLPTFKVRKEKLGDRITALQQLVSPFGKTDTASVLQEAIEYIKFLHDQVGVLSSPYLKDGHPMQHQISSKSKDCDETKQDLRSRGLCLVPITSTYLVASETTADFWHPTFGGSFR